MPEKCTVPRVCEHCGAKFLARQGVVKIGRARYCSRPCYVAHAVACGAATLEGRFWALVEKTDSCWLWSGSTDTHGYGGIRVGSVTDGSVHLEKAHRVAWTLLRGPIPESMEVCHDCPGGDNPACVNPAHLFIGTHADNMADAKRKGRFQNRGMAKLSPAQVCTIRSRHAAGGVLQRTLAAEYGVSRPTVSQIVNGKRWVHLY